MKTLHQRKKKHGRLKVGQKAISASSPTISSQVKDNLGTPVCVVLKDGSLYYGVLNEMQGDQIILQGFKGNRKFPRNKAKAKAQISNLGGLGGLLGGGGFGGMLGLLGGGGSGGFLEEAQTDYWVVLVKAVLQQVLELEVSWVTWAAFLSSGWE